MQNIKKLFEIENNLNEADRLAYEKLINSLNEKVKNISDKENIEEDIEFDFDPDFDSIV